VRNWFQLFCFQIQLVYRYIEAQRAAFIAARDHARLVSAAVTVQRLYRAALATAGRCTLTPPDP
jgi:hypothetical protein